MLQRVRDQRGVAMVTVLLVASVLTVTASAATVMTIREFNAGGDDRQSARALALAESGIDRMIVALKTNDWEDVVLAGCDADHPEIVVEGSTADGIFEAAASRAADLAACPVSGVPSPRAEQQLRILATGESGEATRRVEQMIDVVAGDLPVGIFAHRWVSASGNAGNLVNVSIITPGDVGPRDKIDAQGWDLWYSQRDIYGTGPATTCDLDAGNCNHSNSLPAAVHAGGLITCGTADRCNKTTGQAPKGQNTAHHSPGQTEVVDADLSDNVNKPNLVCTADEVGSESMWDGSGYVPTDPAYGTRGPTTGLSCPGVTHPAAPTSLFTADQARALQKTPALSDDEYATLRDAARTSGIYCTRSGNATTCRYSDGTTVNLVSQGVDFTKVAENYVIFADFEPSGGEPGSLPTLSLQGNTALADCDGDPGRTVSVIVRYGNAEFKGGADVQGAVIAEVGRVTVGGTADINGTIIAKEIEIQGDRTIEMDMCTLNSLTFPLINVSAGAWREIDR